MKNSWAEKTITYILLFIFSIFFIFPIYWTTTSSLKDRGQIFKIPPEWIPNKLTLVNYIDIFQKSKVGIFFFNSFIVAVSTVLGIIIVGALAGFGFSKLKFKGKNILIYLIIIVRMVPSLVYTIPYFVMFKKIGMTDTLTGLIVCYITLNLPFAIWLFLGFFDEIPNEIYESAKIDGCNSFSAFRHIALPLVRPGSITIAILVFLNSWNEFGLALVMIFSESKRTLPIAISSLIQLQKDIPIGTLSAAGIIIMLPALVFSLSVQKYIVKGMLSGSVKG